MCKAVENDSQALCESVCVAVKELWTELNFSTKYLLCNFSIEFILRIIYTFDLYKDFLQNIQGSIFSSSPYDKWLDVIDQGNEEEKITATQR